MDKKRKRDLLLAAGILLLAGVLYLMFRPGGSGAWVLSLIHI